jgi:signal peptidase I
MSWEVVKIIDRKKAWKEVRSWLLAVSFVLLLRGFVVQTFHVPTGSMKNTILIGDFLIINRLKYGLKLPFTDRYLLRIAKPKRGDIIVFRFPVQERNIIRNTNLVKRCVAVEGDTVYIKHKQLYINGKAEEADYIPFRDAKEYGPLDIDNETFQRLWHNRKLRRYPYVRDNFGPVVVPENFVMALGDNRDNSDDSRFWGPVPINLISGTPIFVYWSWRVDISLRSLFRKIRWERIGKTFPQIKE